MDWKVVSAFAAGAVLASGIVYFAVKPEDLATQPAVGTKPAVTGKPAAPPQAITPTPVPQIAATPHVFRTPVREKPSPMPPPLRRERPVTVARYEPPAPRPAPTPAASPAPSPVPVKNVSLPTPAPATAPAPKAEVRVPHVVTLAAGVSLAVRIGESVSSARNQPGDSFAATLTQPLVLDGFIIAERGSRVEGKVVEASPAGHGRGASHLAIAVVQVSTSDGQNIRVRTEPYSKDGSNPATEIAAETRINFRVQESLTITERLN